MGISFEVFMATFVEWSLAFCVCVASRFLDLVPSRFPVLWPLGFPAGWLFLGCRLGLCAVFWGLFSGSSVLPFLLKPWLFLDDLWLAGAIGGCCPVSSFGLLCLAVGLLPSPFLLANVEVYGCWFTSSFPIYIGYFVEMRLVDFGEFISINLRVYLACELVFFFVSSYKTCGFSSSWLLTSFFYTQVTIPSVSFFSQISKQRLVVWKLLVEDKAWLISAVVDRLVCNL
ncbi:hypothetical protein M5K25_002017 [Dendrobium thyrsiflorum]|uniref:Transmembrane protein n=1 Tax=Dendrobium thyrsiflorum TaxID=117978 RepID=A0ABD0W0R4_DENTH